MKAGVGWPVYALAAFALDASGARSQSAAWSARRERAA